MKIDKVLKAHGISILQIMPPVTPTNGIVTNGLVAYWNSKRGINGSTWENIAPATKGQYDAFFEGATVTPDGMSFSNSTDYVQVPIPTELKEVTNATFEMRFKSNGGWADLINQDGRELIWIGPDYLTLSGVFDNDKYREHKYISVDTLKFLYLTITANLNTNEITAYMYDPENDTTVTGSYTTTIGKFAEGNFVWLSRTQTPVNGIMDNIRMYNRVLTQEEIAKNRTIGSDVGI